MATTPIDSAGTRICRVALIKRLTARKERVFRCRFLWHSTAPLEKMESKSRYVIDQNHEVLPLTLLSWSNASSPPLFVLGVEHRRWRRRTHPSLSSDHSQDNPLLLYFLCFVSRGYCSWFQISLDSRPSDYCARWSATYQKGSFDKVDALFLCCSQY